MTNFWHIEAPPYNDYRFMGINGITRHPRGLPGISCDVCKSTWVDGFGPVSFTFPQELLNRYDLTRPMSVETFDQLRDELVKTLGAQGLAREAIRPGMKFQPCHLEVPTRPEADFLWHIGAVVSEKIRCLIEAESLSGVSFAPARIVKMGRRKPSRNPRIPRSGEPEDMLRQAKVVPSTEDAPSYYDLIVTAASTPPSGVKFGDKCQRCGHQDFSPPARWSMEGATSPGTDFFHLSPTTMIIVSERAKAALEHAGATNVHYEPM